MSAPEDIPSKSQLERAAASDESIQKVHAVLAEGDQKVKEGRSRLPLVLLGFGSVLIFFAAIYMVRNRGGFDPLAYDPKFDPQTAVAATAVKVDPIADGQKLFTGTCATCHQATGQGVPGTFPPLAGSEWVQGSEERAIRILLNGLSGPVKVAGADYNSAMPAFGPGGYGWSDDKIAHVLTYVRQAWGNKAPEVAVEKVAEIRAAVGQRKPWSAEELEAIK